MKPLTEASKNASGKVYYPNLKEQAQSNKSKTLFFGFLYFVMGFAIWYKLFLHSAAFGETAKVFIALTGFVFCAIMALVLPTLDTPPHLNFLCPECGKHLTTFAPWTCGYCDYQNSAAWFAWQNSFLSKCFKCEQQPASIACHHCGYRICLDESADERNPSYHKVPPVPGAKLNAPSGEETEAQQIGEIKRLEREKQRIEYETQVMQSRIALATAESRLAEVNGKRENPFGQAIRNMLDPLKTANERREALLMYERNTRQSILGRTDLSDEEKGRLIDDLAIDVEQARLGDT